MQPEVWDKKKQKQTSDQIRSRYELIVVMDSGLPHQLLKEQFLKQTKKEIEFLNIIKIKKLDNI